ncbi:MAG: ABC transporter permease [Ottowia sp.]|nr:ABC transporter permease [Halieaceae bacterium]MCB2069834.1 ABC transporter permease [Ottowia sp.]MCP5146614.1 ABC transporter permease [Pseudomonadales bacterium]MCP5166517.1 ABC transporter permease [Pseudomonadales bacterium]MCP5186412.1 ABC transporter permease [Pseudomonadales bacterium]
MSPGDRLRLAARYTFSLGGGQLSTFLSSLSMLGLVLAISLLVIVLSVMNGFDKEMRERILGMVPHVTLHSHAPIADWRQQAALVAQHPDVLEVTPFVEFDALFMRGNQIETARGLGLARDDAAAVARLLGSLPPAALDLFREQEGSLVLGVGIADRLQVVPGDEITLIVPGIGQGGNVQPTRFEVVRLAGVLETRTELDEVAAIVPLALASELAGIGSDVNGLRIVTSDLFDVARIGWELVNNMPPGYYATNWMMTHGNLYSAIQLSRDLITVLLFSIIAVAAFNVVSSLVLVVFDKQGNIAILRTLGASPADIAAIFVLQGAMIGLVGVVLGALLGALGSLAVPDLVAGLEQLLDINFLNTDVYPVSFLPVDLLLRDVLLVSGIALAMCVVAAIYPALRAARLAPALVLNQDR